MEYEFFDPTNQSHKELVNMMMQMENNPEFSDVPPSSVIDFSVGSTTSAPHAFHSAAPATVAGVNPSSTVSLAGHSNSYPGGTGIAPAGCDGDRRMRAMREVVFRIAAMQPVNIDPESVKPPKRRNVKISKDPQSVAARHRRERISERIRILQRLVPGGTRMDTASMLDEAIHYVKFLKTQLESLERVAANPRPTAGTSGSENYWPHYQQQQQQHIVPTQMLQ